MTVRLNVVFQTGREETIRDYVSFPDAIEDAIELADGHGDDPGDGAGPPIEIRVYRNDNLEFSVIVIRGGLANGEAITQKVGKG